MRKLRAKTQSDSDLQRKIIQTATIQKKQKKISESNQKKLEEYECEHKNIKEWWSWNIDKRKYLAIKKVYCRVVTKIKKIEIWRGKKGRQTEESH